MSTLREYCLLLFSAYAVRIRMFTRLALIIPCVLSSVLLGSSPSHAQGKVVTEGDKELKADVARKLFKVDGAGVKVGIISTSFDIQKKAAADVASGDLPGAGNPQGRNVPVQVLKDHGKDTEAEGDEGRALAQIVHDIAPGAELFFHTALSEDPAVIFPSDESYAAAVDTLTKAGVDVIIDDAQFPTAIFQDGDAAQAVRRAVAKGITYASAAGNNGAISYQGAYRVGNESFKISDKNFEAYDFDPGSGVDLFQDINVTKDGTLILPHLTWDNPAGKITSDLEMLLLDSPKLPGQGGNILAVSGMPNNGAGKYPVRLFAFSPTKDQTLYLMIVRELNGSPAPNVVKWISKANGLDRTTKYQYINSSDQEIGSSTVFGPANADEVLTVGATDLAQNPGARVTPPEISSFSSRGGSPILFDDSGNPLPIPKVRSKPEITAPNGGQTTFDAGTGFNPFRGSSASVAHIGGVVALMEQAAGGGKSLPPKKVKAILQGTSIPLSPQPGVPTSTGFAQADRAVAVARKLAYGERN
jgi:Subtilase family